MKYRVIPILLICASISSMQAVRKVSKPMAAQAKTADSQVKQLLKAIETADLDNVDKQLQASAETINDHTKEFSPLGKAYYELRQNKLVSNQLPKSEKGARTRRLKKIIERLEQQGATLIYDDSAGNMHNKVA